MQGEIFDEMIENLSLQAQEEELKFNLMNYQSILNKYSNLLKFKHIKSPKLDCEILLSHALKSSEGRIIDKFKQKNRPTPIQKF